MSVDRRNLSLRGLVVVAAAILAVAIGAIGLTIWALRIDAAEDAGRDAVNISTILADQSAKTVQSILEDAIYEAAPDMASLTIEGLEGKPASGFVGLDQLLSSPPPDRILASSSESGD